MKNMAGGRFGVVAVQSPVAGGQNVKQKNMELSFDF